MGKVIGTVWSTVKWERLNGLKFLLVRPYTLDDLQTKELTSSTIEDGVVVADNLDAGVGDDVIIAYGHSARVAIETDLKKGQNPSTPIDAAVVAIVDRYNVQDDTEARAN